MRRLKKAFAIALECLMFDVHEFAFVFLVLTSTPSSVINAILSRHCYKLEKRRWRESVWFFGHQNEWPAGFAVWPPEYDFSWSSTLEINFIFPHMHVLFSIYYYYYHYRHHHHYYHHNYHHYYYYYYCYYWSIILISIQL